MTRQDFTFKWLLYGLSLLPIFWLEIFVLNRFPVMGVIPLLLPTAATAVAVLEGPIGGAGFGLAVGILCDAIYYGSDGVLTLALCVLCWVAGAAARYVLMPSFGGCILCTAGVLGCLGLGRVAWGVFTQLAPVTVLLQVALPEFFWSLAFVCLIYPWIAWAKKRIYHFLRILS